MQLLHDELQTLSNARQTNAGRRRGTKTTTHDPDLLKELSDGDQRSAPQIAAILARGLPAKFANRGNNLVRAIQRARAEAKACGGVDTLKLKTFLHSLAMNMSTDMPEVADVIHTIGDAIPKPYQAKDEAERRLIRAATEAIEAHINGAPPRNPARDEDEIALAEELSKLRNRWRDPSTG